jgi:ferredoxin-NADP reductase
MEEIDPKAGDNALRKIYQTEVLARRWLCDNAFELTLRRPASYEFTPGQRIRFLHEGLERDYSLTSTMKDPHLGLCVRLVKGGKFSPVLAASPLGTPFSFSGPHGYFTFKESQNRTVLIATGTGIAPFVSMVQAGLTDFTLIHGVKTAEELFYESLLREASDLYIPCLSRTPDAASQVSGGFSGRVTDYVEQSLFSGVYNFYLCGRRDMIHDVTLLVDEHFPGSLVYTEIYYG